MVCLSGFSSALPALRICKADKTCFHRNAAKGSTALNRGGQFCGADRRLERAPRFNGVLPRQENGVLPRQEREGRIGGKSSRPLRLGGEFSTLVVNRANCGRRCCVGKKKAQKGVSLLSLAIIYAPGFPPPFCRAA